MRAEHLLPLLLLSGLSMAGCGAAPREPALAGYLHIFETARNARQACAGLLPGCTADGLEQHLTRAEEAAPRELFVPQRDAGEDRLLARTALEAADADCRVRRLRPGSARWDSCLLDRGVARLREAAGGRGGVPETTKGASRRPSEPSV
ncbi:hypothetical protein [Roseomonas indoligenes]|uniref:Uncharacterized protein n=1 Tax=Roseomonas indoligenes TaxID=2820811 RepID=A0A940S6Z3_9PROT|nr:hypothetical protein [Pararoseomonas indoligenes]MBP0492552.1 hypothetical protein [Pararoseomonas indoligenes]